MNNTKKIRIILSGGGTGGHIFPAVAIANAIKALSPDAEFLFVGAKGRMEMEKVPQAGYKIKGLWISGLKREFSFSNLLFPLKIVVSLWKAFHIVKQFKPDMVIGTGGYASGPTLRAASLLKIPTAIQEQNSFPGITNKLLADKAQRIYTAYEGLEKYFPPSKVILSGNPIRQDAVDIAGKRGDGARYFGIDPHKTTLLVVGGSQGARSINNAVITFINRLADNNIQLIWQTGVSFEADAKKALEPFEKDGLKAFAFINRMDLAYSAADIIISRAGAIAIAELCVVGKPVILVPLPTAAEDHQRHNAEALVMKGAALLVADKQLKEKLATEVLSLASDTERCRSLGNAIALLARPHADKTIAEDILNQLNLDHDQN